MKSKFKAIISSIAMLLFAISTTYSQTITTGEVTGTIKDQTGAVVPNAAVTLKNSDNGQTQTVTSNDSGQYRFTTLQAGNYQISASTPGLKAATEKLVVGVGQVATINLTLTTTVSTQEITVTEAAPVLQSDNPNISTTLTARQIQNLPMPGGDTTTPAFTAPGITVSTGAGYGNFSSHGLPSTSNLFTVNGNDNMDPYLNVNNSGASNLTLGANEIDEVAVVENPYDPAYGRQAGAQVNEVTKSGTNELHGNLVWNWNGAYLDANDFFSNASSTPRGRANSNQYAASIGGPVVIPKLYNGKDKTFFFIDTEGLRYILPSASTVAIPSPQFQSYILGTVAPSQVPLYQQAFNLYNSAPGVNRAVPVTTGQGVLQDSSGNLGCGSLAGTLPNGLGTTVPCAYAFGTNVVNGNTEWLLTSRLDQQITDKQRIFFRFKTDHGHQPTFTDPINSAFNVQSIQPEYDGQADYTYAISPNVVNHVIGSASWYSAFFTPSSVPTALSTFPTYFDFFSVGGPNGDGGTLTPLGLNTTLFPQGRNVGQFQVLDDLSIIHGNHSIKVGLNFRKNRVTDSSPEILTQGGAYIFTNPADFATGLLSSGSYYEQAFSAFDAAHLRFYNIGMYAQDEWAITPKFKLTYGLRLDRTANPLCVGNCFSRLASPFAGDPNGASIPYNQTIETGLSHMVANIEPIVYEPRIAFVWSVTNKTVIRAGAGIFSDQFPGGVAPNVFDNAPNSNIPNIYSGLIAGNAAFAGGAPSIASAANSAFQSGFVNGYTLGQIQASMPAGTAFATPNFYSTPNKLYNPKYAEWSFEIQQQLDSKSVFDISYVGNHGYDLLLQNGMLNAYNANGIATFGMLPSSAPDARFNQVTGLANDGISNYNGLTVQYRRSLGYGFQGQVNYTWSHALDDLSDVVGEYYSSQTSLSYLLYPYNKSLNYSNSDFDIRHQINADFTWALPYKFQNHILSTILGNWTMGSKIYWRTGMPYSIVENGEATAVSPTMVGVSTGNGLITNGLLASVIDPNIPTSCTSPNQTCFSPSQLAVNGFGNYPRNTFRGPGYFDIDYTVAKAFPIKERAQFRIGASFYNLLNHPNFNAPNMDAVGGGTIGSTVTPPTSAYGSFVGAAVSGRVIVTNATFQF